MRRHVAIVYFVEVVGRKVDHPHWSEAGFSVAFFMAELGTQSTQRVVHDFGFVGAEENNVARFRMAGVDNLAKRFPGKEFHYWGLQAFSVELGCVVDLDVRQSFGTVDGGEAGEVVELLPGEHRVAARQTQCGNFAVLRAGRIDENLEARILDDVGQFGEFETNP